MRRYTIFFLLASVVAGFASCNNVDITPDTPEQPSVSKYEQLTFSSADEPSTRAVWADPNGSGSLVFNWEVDDKGTEMVALLSDGSAFVRNYSSENPTDEDLQEALYHTYMTISPKEDLHRADFKTVRYYNKEDKDAAKAVYAVTPVNDFCIFEADETSFSAQMEMPAVFVQSFSQTPEFLCDYMMMYGLGEFENGSASISFKHIPATFRFIITNMRPTTARLENVSLSVDGGAPIGSNYAEVHGDYTTESLYVDFAGNHTSITTLLNTTLESQETYTAYAMALPLGNNETLEDKDIKFVITTEEHEFLSFVLKGEQIAGANPNGEYNWVSGKSYTIRMSLNDVLTFEEISVADWAEMEVGGGVAEEIPNTFDATAMTPEQLNAAVTEALEYGHTEIYVTLAADADATMFSAITAALAATVDPTLDPWEMEGILGTIDLTISGAKKVFDSAFGMLEGYNENWRAGAVMKTLTLPDVIEIEDYGINFCPNLTSVSAPKCEVLGEGALAENNALTSVYMPAARIIGNSTGGNYGPFCMCDNLTEISLPEATTLGNSAFAACWNLKTLYLPKVTEIIGCDAFKACDNLEEITLGALTTVNNANAGTFKSVTTGNVALVLSADQKAMNYDSSTKIYTAGTDAFDFNTTSFIGYTFKSISKQE